MKRSHTQFVREHVHSRLSSLSHCGLIPGLRRVKVGYASWSPPTNKNKTKRKAQAGKGLSNSSLRFLACEDTASTTQTVAGASNRLARSKKHCCCSSAWSIFIRANVYTLCWLNHFHRKGTLSCSVGRILVFSILLVCLKGFCVRYFPYNLKRFVNVIHYLLVTLLLAQSVEHFWLACYIHVDGWTMFSRTLPTRGWFNQFHQGVVVTVYRVYVTVTRLAQPLS